MRENTSNDVNSGFFIIKNNDNITNIINFFVKYYKHLIHLKRKHAFGDQSVINTLKSNLNYDFIPNDYVVCGTVIFNSNKVYSIMR